MSKKYTYIEMKDKKLGVMKVVEEYAKETHKSLLTIGQDLGFLKSGVMNEHEVEMMLNNVSIASINYVLKYPEKFERKILTEKQWKKIVDDEIKKKSPLPVKETKRESYFG